MFHEILLCLSGLPNSLQEDIANISELEDILHPCELKLLERVLVISNDYTMVKQFIETNLYSNTSSSSSNTASASNSMCMKANSGLYLKAFCEGLSQSLDPYRQDLKSLESQFFNEPRSTSITSVLFTFEKHHPLLEFMVKIIKEVVEKQIHGCQILSHLYEHTLFGFGDVKTATRRISLLCHKILIKQLKSWFFNGTLLDPHEEFFIRSVKTMAPPGGENLHDATMTTTLNSTAMTAVSLGLASQEKTKMKEYEIRIVMLPCYLHVSLATKILFIGETILMLSWDIDSSGLKNVHNFFEEREDELRAELDSLLSEEVLHVIRLEKIVDTLKFCVTKYLWSLVIHRSDLYSHLKYMKDFFLLGWGEFFVEFLVKTGTKLQNNVASFAAENLNQAFIQSARNLLFVDENVISKFNFTVEKNPKEKLINQLFLHYKPDWPLQLLFTTPIIENYNTLFKFLLRLKKVQIDLHKIWLRDTKQKNTCISATWRLRTHLSHWLDNLQYYLQVDVLESEYSLLIQAVQNSADFEHIQMAHIEFQSNVLSKAFIYAGEPSSSNVLSHGQNPLSVTVHPVNHLMCTILDMGETFCRLATSSSASRDADLRSLADRFDVTMGNLILLMCELRRLRSRSNQIEQLLTRLDYNKWFTRELKHKLEHG